MQYTVINVSMSKRATFVAAKLKPFVQINASISTAMGKNFFQSFTNFNLVKYFHQVTLFRAAQKLTLFFFKPKLSVVKPSLY